MNKIIALSVLSAFLVGCATSHPTASSTADTCQKFYEGKSADLIIEYNSWNYSYLLKPVVTDGTFRREVSTNEIGAILTERNVPRKLAVVKLGWIFEIKCMQETMDRWTTVLNQTGFERIVFIRSTSAPDLAGAMIIRDTRSNNNPPLESFMPKPQDPATIPVVKEPKQYMAPVRPFASL